LGLLRLDSDRRGVRPLSGFVMVLSYSRAIFALFTVDQTLESFLRGHVDAFETWSGVARTLVYDKLRSAVLERAGTAIRFHPRLLELAGHYHFAPRPCTPGRGNEKGKVERQSSTCATPSLRRARLWMSTI
jgi:transposase